MISKDFFLYILSAKKISMVDRIGKSEPRNASGNVSASVSSGNVAAAAADGTEIATPGTGTTRRVGLNLNRSPQRRRRSRPHRRPRTAV